MVAATAAFIFNQLVLPALLRAGAGATIQTIAALAVNVAVRAAAFMAVGALIKGLTPRPSIPSPELPIRQPTPRRKSAFGRVRGTGAYLAYEEVDGDSIDVLALHYGRIGGIDEFWLHDDKVTLGTGRLGAGHVQGNSSTHQYFDAIYMDSRLGIAGQTALQRASTMLPSSVWSTQHRAEGVALIELLCLGTKQSRLAKVYPRGLPRPNAVYRAQYVYDWTNPAHDIGDWTTWAPGDRNPIRQLVTFMINPREPDPAEPDRCLGLGEDFDETFGNSLAILTAAAAVCDQQVARAGGGFEPRYTCDFEYFVGEDPADTIQRFLDSCDGWMGEDGQGGLVVRAGAFEVPTVELSRDWITGFDISRGERDEGRKNVVQAFWTDPANKFARVEADRWYDVGNIALTGKQRVLQAEFVQVQSHGQTRRLVKRIASRLTAAARGAIICDLNALVCFGKRYLRLPADFAEGDELAGAVIEVDGIEIDLEEDRVVISWILADPAIDDWDPNSEEGMAPPAGGSSSLLPTPVVDAGAVAASVTTDQVFGGDRTAHAILAFAAPTREFDLGASVIVSEPRADLDWVVRWRINGSGDNWTEAVIEGDVLSGDQQSGYTATLKTPALPRALLDVQIAAKGAGQGRGDWSADIVIDVPSATAPALDPVQNLTAAAAIDATPGGVRRPALTVGFDAITDPQAQMVVIATKAPGAAESTFSQIDMVEPRMGERKTWNVPVGETVDVGVRVWAKWREPSDWVVVAGVVIPDELGASNVGGATIADIDQAVADVQAQIDEATDEVANGATDFADAMATLRDSFATGHATIEDAVQARLGLIDTTSDTLAGDIRTQARDTLEALAVSARSAMAVQAQIEQNQVLEESLGNYTASFSSQIAVIIDDIGSLTTQVDAWTAANVTGDITSALTAEINARVAGDTAQADRSDTIETTANDARSKANDILAMTVSTSSALALRFSGIEQNVSGLQTNYTNIVNLENIGSSALVQRLENIEAEQDPATPGGLRARIDEAAEIQLADNAARTREIRETQAAVARAALSVTSLRETTLFENEAALRLIEEANLAIGTNTASFQSIVDMTLSASSALVLRFAAIELDLDETEAGSLAASVADHEYALFDGVAGLSGRMSAVEASLNPGTPGSVAARVTGLEEARVTDSAATAREIRELWAASARTSVGLTAQVEAFASENENTLRIIETARLETADVDLRVDSILDLSIVDGTALGTRLESIETATNNANAAIQDAQEVQASDHAAALRILREAEALMARTALMARSMIDARATEDEAILTELNTFRVQTSQGLAQLESSKITAVDLDNAFSAFGLNLLTVFSIPDALDDLDQDVANIEADLDPLTPGSVAEAAFGAATSADIAGAFASFGWNVAAAYDVEDRLSGIDQAVDSAASVAAAATTVAEAQQLIADYTFTVEATTQNASAWFAAHAQAITTMQGGAGVVYSIELNADGHISGLYATNDGTSANWVLAVDTLTIGKGANTVKPFRFDTGTNTFHAQNIEIDFALINNVVIGNAQIEDAAITSLKMANGSVGVELEADRRDNEVWYSGGASNPTTTTQFRTFSEYTGWADVKPGDSLRLELDYMIQATIDSFEWLLFEDELEFQFEYEDGSTAFYSPDDAVSERRLGAASNTGGGPSVSGVLPSNDHRSIARVKIGTPTSTPWMSLGGLSPLKRVRARYFIRTRGGNATTTCIYGGTYVGAAVRAGLKLVYAECLLTKNVSGPIQT